MTDGESDAPSPVTVESGTGAGTDTEGLGIKTSLLGAEKVAERIDETDQLNERSVGQTIGQGISPPYPPEQLTSLLELNGTVATGVQKKARREVGFGFDIVGHDRVSDPAPEQRERVADFWYGPETIWKVGPTGTPTASPIEVLQKARKDFHTVGWLALELLYAGADTELVGMAHLPAATVRLKRHEDADRDERKAGHGFVQELDGQTRYFAEAGDRHNTTLDGDPNPIYVDKEDGEVVEGEPPEDVQPANELLFVRNNHPNTIYYGLPDHIAELQTIVADQQARDFNRKFFEYDAIPAYLFIVEGGTLSESEREELRGIISQLRNKEGRRAAIIEAEELGDSDFGSGDVSIRVEQLTQQGEEDMSFESFRRHNERTIASALEVPVQLLGRTESANRSNSEQAITDFIKTVIEPAQERFAGRLYSTLHQDILDAPDWTLEFQTRGGEDERRQAEIARTRIGPEWLVNEAREALGLEPIDELDGVLVGDAFDATVQTLPRDAVPDERQQ